MTVVVLAGLSAASEAARAPLQAKQTTGLNSQPKSGLGGSFRAKEKKTKMRSGFLTKILFFQPEIGILTFFSIFWQKMLKVEQKLLNVIFFGTIR